MSLEIRKPLKFQGDKLKRAQARRSIEEVFKACAKDRYLLLAIVCGGLAYWMKTARKAFTGLMVNDIQLETMFHTLQEHAGEHPDAQLHALERAELVALKLDRLKGLARFIMDERHLDQVLERNLPDNAERAAIRQQMLILIKGGTVH